MTEIPRDHPRYASLTAREKIVEGLRKGWVAEAGLTAHGRGEAFDYLLGETTPPPAREAIRAAAALLLTAERPVLSLNGNVVALAREEIAGLLAVLNRARYIAKGIASGLSPSRARKAARWLEHPEIKPLMAEFNNLQDQAAVLTRSPLTALTAQPSREAAVATPDPRRHPAVAGHRSDLSRQTCLTAQHSSAGLGQPCRLAVAEVCLFHRTEARIAALVEAMAEVGVAALGREPDDHIPGLSHARALCDSRGIGAADVVLVPLEDGDRAQALRDMGKQVITIDLNPLSRTARTAHITIVDELTRAVPRLTAEVGRLAEAAGVAGGSEACEGEGRSGGPEAWQRIFEEFSNEANLAATLEFMRARLGEQGTIQL